MVKIENTNRLNGYKILVTGATSGLGYSVSSALAKEGAHVIAIGRDKRRLEDLSDAIEKSMGTVSLACIDLAKKETIEDLSQRIAAEFGTLNVVIHCAMPSHQMTPVNQVSLKEVEINLLSPITICLRLISCFHGLLAKDPIALVIYISDYQAQKFNGLYNSAKRACDQLFLTYKEENKRLGVDVIIQYPGPMKTKLRKKLFPGEKSINSESVEVETKKIVEKILVLTGDKGIIA